MSGRNKILLIIITMVVMAVVIFFLAPSSGVVQTNKNKQYVSDNWSKPYFLDSKNPKGLHLFKELLKAKIGDSTKFENYQEWSQVDSSLTANSGNRTFVFVGEYFDISRRKTRKIVDKIKEGSTLFLSFEEASSAFKNVVLTGVEFSFEFDSKVDAFNEKEKFRIYNIFQNDTIATKWRLFDPTNLNSDVEVLSTVMEQPNFIHIKKGKGHIYIHLNPEMFVNYQVLRDDGGFQQMHFALQAIPEDQSTIFLTFAQQYFDDEQMENDSTEDSGSQRDDSFLREILSKPASKIALLLSLLGVLLFVLFRSKRMRPVVPYIHQKKDMTLAFAETITSIYYSKQNAQQILTVMRKNYYATVQKHFFIDLSRRKGEREIVSLSEKSNYSLEEIKHLLSLLEQKQVPSENALNEIQKRQHAFYKDAGIITERVVEAIDEKDIVLNRSIAISSILLGLGVLILIIGLALLTQSSGIGIVTWPVGGIITIYAILRLSSASYIISKQNIVRVNLFGKKSSYETKDIIRKETKGSSVILTLTNNRELNINLWDIDRFDKSQIERFLSTLSK